MNIPVNFHLPFHYTKDFAQTEKQCMSLLHFLTTSFTS